MFLHLSKSLPINWHSEPWSGWVVQSIEEEKKMKDKMC